MDSMAKGTSVQTGLTGMGKESAQVKALEESNTAAGQGGSKQPLIEAKQTAKPLPGQPKLKATRKRQPKIKVTESREELELQHYELAERINTMEADINASPIKKLLPLISSHGKSKGELDHLTPKQFKEYTGRPARPSIIDKNGFIPWHLALDQFATEYGYKSDEALKNAVEKLRDTQHELAELKNKLKGTKAYIRTKETERPEMQVTMVHNTAPVFPKDETVPEIVTEANGLTLSARRNPSFWQISDNNPATPDVRARLAKVTRQIMNTAARSHIEGLASHKVPKLTRRFKRLPR